MSQAAFLQHPVSNVTSLAGARCAAPTQTGPWPASPPVSDVPAANFITYRPPQRFEQNAATCHRKCRSTIQSKEVAGNNGAVMKSSMTICAQLVVFAECNI